MYFPETNKQHNKSQYSSEIRLLGNCADSSFKPVRYPSPRYPSPVFQPLKHSTWLGSRECFKIILQTTFNHPESRAVVAQGCGGIRGGPAQPHAPRTGRPRPTVRRSGRVPASHPPSAFVAPPQPVASPASLKARSPFPGRLSTPEPFLCTSPSLPPSGAVGGPEENTVRTLPGCSLPVPASPAHPLAGPGEALGLQLPNCPAAALGLTAQSAEQ